MLEGMSNTEKARHEKFYENVDNIFEKVINIVDEQ